MLRSRTPDGWKEELTIWKDDGSAPSSFEFAKVLIQRTLCDQAITLLNQPVWIALCEYIELRTESAVKVRYILVRNPVAPRCQDQRES